MGACDLLKQWLIWRIGDGTTVKIYGDKWIPSITYSVQSPRSVLDGNATVNVLIDQATKWWNITLIKEIFYEDKVRIIMQLPLSCYNQPDVLICTGTVTCKFSLRSAYHGKRITRQAAGRRFKTIGEPWDLASALEP